jgi:hypothetical protein
MKYLFGLTLVALASTLGVSQQNAQPTRHRLDLYVVASNNDDTLTPPPGEEPGVKPFMPPPPVADAGPVPRFPFDVTLTSTDRNGYTVGESMIFEIELRNVSKRPVAVPWTIDRSLIRSTMPGARALVVSLTFTHAVQGEETIGHQTVYGAEAVPGTLRTIEPGEILEMRAEVPLNLHKWWPRGSETSTNKVRVKALVSLASRDQYYPPATSQNDAVIQLRGK